MHWKRGRLLAGIAEKRKQRRKNSGGEKKHNISKHDYELAKLTTRERGQHHLVICMVSLH